MAMLFDGKAVTQRAVRRRTKDDSADTASRGVPLALVKPFAYAAGGADRRCEIFRRRLQETDRRNQIGLPRPVGADLGRDG